MTAARGATSMVDGRGQSRIIAGFAGFFSSSVIVLRAKEHRLKVA